MDFDALDDELMDAIASLARQAKATNQASVALKSAAAANQLAEARAWLLAASQPHGSFSIAD